MPSAIETAIKENDSHTVHSFLTGSRPLPADIRNEASQTGLMIACANNKSCETAKVILDQSSNLSAEDLQGWTALHYAAESGSLECVKLLIEHKAEVDATNDNIETPLHFAAENNFYDIVKLLIDNKADINLSAEDLQGWTALHYAAKNGSLESVKILIDHKAEIDATTDKTETALFLATKHNHPDIVEFLAENNCHLLCKKT